MKHIDKILETVSCSDQDKVEFAKFKLDGSVDEWWTLEKVVLARRADEVPVEIT